MSAGNQCFVVGIGASAGGLEAVSQLVGVLPADFDMALVLVTHMSPTQESSLPEILSKISKIPVVALRENVHVEPNHLYVMSPNTEIVLSKENLKLMSCKRKDKVPMPIDRFLSSLAGKKRERAIAVILSGEGSDGAIGMRAVKDEGGITFAQDPCTTQHPSMPASAIATDCVDFVLSPGDIALELRKLAAHPIVWSPLQGESLEPPQQDEKVSKILRLIHRIAGTDFSPYKQATIERRIQRRMLLHKLDSVGSYLKHLEGDSTEVEKLFDDLLIQVTGFFRDNHLFQALNEKVFPTFLERNPPKAPIRIWVPGCSTGEEVYSIAISLLEFLENRAPFPEIQIFGTDLSEKAIQFAREGVYLENVSAHLSEERLARFLRPTERGYQISKAIRDICVFSSHDITRDPPFSRIDLVSCRNLLIYFDSELHKRVLSRLHYALNLNGFLALGPSETIGGFSNAFSVVDKKNKIYSKKFSTKHQHFEPVQGRGTHQIPPVASSDTKEGGHVAEEEPIQAADRIILSQMAPPGFLVNDELDILQFRGDTAAYVKHPHGTSSLNLLKVIHPRLAMEVRRLIHVCRNNGVVQSKQATRISHNGSSRRVRLHVTPIKVKRTSQNCFLVMVKELDSSVEEATLLNRDKRHNESQGKPADNVSELQFLRQDLQETREHLQSIIEEQESTNEELKSANEEILSSNEELQSTNEELETAKEELQSTNEELNTVNDELQHRAEELTQISNDLNNFITSTNLPALMLTNELYVRRFTPQSQKLFRLIPTDLGRPLKDISPNFIFPELEDTCLKVIDTRRPEEKEIQTTDGSWYRLRIRPYRTCGNKIEGIVLTFVDIGQLKKAKEMVEQSLRSVEATLQTVHEPLLELDDNLCVVRVNRSFCRCFRVSKEATIGLSVYDIGNGQWNIPELRQLLEEVIPKKKAFDGFLVERDFERIGSKKMLLNGRQIFQMGKGTKNILLGIEDITEHTRLENELVETKVRAQDASRAKSEFLANMSHEIRTPLTSIIGFSKILADASLPDSERQKYTNRINRNAKQLNSLIDDILDLSRVECGRLEIHNEKYDTTTLLSETFTIFSPLANHKNLQFDIIATGPIPKYIVSDNLRTQQVLSNIVANAIKFTAEGSVRVSVELTPSPTDADHSHLAFKISDTGCGISKEVQEKERLFGYFLQADGSIRRKYGGTGLGLGLSQQLARALGGDLVLTESALGKGSTFTVTIDPGPLQEVPLLDSLTKESLGLDERASDTPASNGDLKGAKILLVDDCEDIHILVSHMLEGRGAKVSVATSAMEGIRQAQSGSYDLVLMDIQMPEMDGFEAISRLIKGGYNTPIVALTARLMKEEREKCMQLGCFDCVAKPVGFPALYDLVSTIINKNTRNATTKSEVSY